MARPINVKKNIDFLNDLRNKFDTAAEILSMKISEKLLNAYRVSISEFYRRPYGGYMHHGFMYLGIDQYGGGDFNMGTPYLESESGLGYEKIQRKALMDFIKSGSNATSNYSAYRHTTNRDAMTNIYKSHPFKKYIKKTKKRIKIGFTVSGDWVFNRAYGEDIHGAMIGETTAWVDKHNGWRHPYWIEHEHHPENSPSVNMEKRFNDIKKNLSKESKKVFDDIFKYKKEE